ncbi:MAG: hypothetical protein ACT4QE_24135 [Anaerolineales bacterium]
MWVVNRIMVWLCALCLAGLQIFGMPKAGCISGYRWGVCWQFPRYGYSVAVAAFEKTWGAAGCVPGAVSFATQYSPASWSCVLESP